MSDEAFAWELEDSTLPVPLAAWFCRQVHDLAWCIRNLRALPAFLVSVLLWWLDTVCTWETRHPRAFALILLVESLIVSVDVVLYWWFAAWHGPGAAMLLVLAASLFAYAVSLRYAKPEFVEYLPKPWAVPTNS